VDRQQLLEDLLYAYYAARKHKRNTINQLRFEFKQEEEIISLCDEILTRTYTLRPSICFVIDQPVKREVFAADFRDRVVHHLLFNYINPVFERSFINDSYSCREEKGTLYGINRINGFIKECSENYTRDCYVLKLDIQGYFMNIDKNILLDKIDKMLLCRGDIACNAPADMVDYLIHEIVLNDPRQNCIIKGKRSDWDCLPPSKSLFHSLENCGLPIGNLTSQLFSNVYLHYFDCFVKNDLEIKYYGRYVDDFVLVHTDKAFLLSAKEEIRQYLSKECHLTLHPKKIYLQHYTKGIKFLGAIIKPNRLYIDNRAKHNFYLCVKGWEQFLASHSPQKNDILQMRSSLNSYLGLMRHFKTCNIRRKVLLGEAHLLFRYGYFTDKLLKYKVVKTYLNPKNL
jgi:retron-type reverse transcriptase